MPSRTTRGLVFGALMAALTVVFVGGAMVLPLTVHLPLPVALVTLRHGLRYGVLSGIVASLLAALLFGWVNVALVLIPLGLLPGLVLGWALYTRRGPAAAGAFTALAGLAGLLLTVALSLLIMGQNPLDVQIQTFSDAMRQAVSRLPAPQQELYRPLLDALPTLMRTLLPLALVLNAALMALLTYYLVHWLFPRLGHPVEPLPPFARWALPVWSVWAYVLVMTPALLLERHLPAWAATVVTNVALGMQFLFALQGAAVASWWLQERQAFSPRAATWTAILLLFMPYLGPAAGFLGVLDLALDFRRLRPGPRARTS